MKKVLFTMLRSQSDCVRSSHLITSFRESNPHSEISVLTFKEFHPFCKLINNVSHIFSIDREAITSFFNNEIYSDALGINTFSKDMELMQKISWDTIINLSNDLVSSYLVSGLDTQEIIGTHIGSFGSSITTNSWNTYLNSAAAKEKERSIALIDTKSHLLSSPLTSDSIKIKLNEDHSLTASKNFAKIRNMKPEGNCKIIGISLMDGIGNEYIDHSTLVTLIDNFETSDEYKVVLLSNGSDLEKQTVNKLNKEFNDSLITIKADTSALASVLINLDSLITCSNIHAALAEALDVFTIEITTYEKNSLIEKEGHYIIEAKEDFSQDLLFLINQKFNTILPVETLQSSNCLYETVKDEFGNMKTLIRGDVDITRELSYHLRRCYNYALMGHPVNTKLLRDLQANVEKNTLHSFIDENKEHITSYVKILLSAIRSLKTTKETGKNSEVFIQCLDKLFQASSDNSIASSALGLLEGRVENITSKDFESNLNQIEKYLFELKSDLQILTNIFSDLIFSPKDKSPQKTV